MGMRKIHYGWVICVTCTLLLFVTMGDSIQWILHLPALYHGGSGADPCPDLLPGDPSLPGGLCGHAPDWRILSKGVPAGGDRACRVLCGLAFWLYSAAETYPLFVWGRQCPGSAMVWAR